MTTTKVLAFRIFILALAILAGLPQCLAGQSEHTATFHFAYNDQLLDSGDCFGLTSGDTVCLDRVRIYVANQGKEPENQHNALLLDLDHPEQDIAVLKYDDSLCFTLGIDSLQHARGAMQGPLDPLNGMYWTWQSGYINVKIEGTARHCPARNHRFQFHIGGYRENLNTSHQIAVKLEPGADRVVLDLAPFFSAVDLSEEYEIMRPCPRAVDLSTLLSQSFEVRP